MGTKYIEDTIIERLPDTQGNRKWLKEVAAYDGRESMRPAYAVKILIGSRLFQDVLVASVPRRNILLGRDILNQLRLTLDGPQQTIEIYDV
jgi:hypothetical protein